MKLALTLVLVAGCGHVQATDVLFPTHLAVVEACRQVKLKAVAEADSREEAVDDVARIERRCQAAFLGLEVATGLLQEVDQ
jgi:nitrogen regulatory protein PII